jgi:cytochrome P450
MAGFEFASRMLHEFGTLVFRDYSLKLAAILTCAAASTPAVVDVQDLFLRLTLDLICETGFGIQKGDVPPVSS